MKKQKRLATHTLVAIRKTTLRRLKPFAGKLDKKLVDVVTLACEQWIGRRGGKTKTARRSAARV